MDHNVPTTEDRMAIKDAVSRAQVEALQQNCDAFGVSLFGLGDDRQGIVHVIGPELGITLPGLTIVCGDSHTSTHGAFGALAFGIGTSEVEHVLVTQTLVQKKPRTYRVEFTGRPGPHISAKDMVLKMIGTMGTAGGSGHVLEYCGEAIRALSMEGRMTICNMSIEAGARAGMIAPDDTTFDYITGRERAYAPTGDALDRALAYWRSLPSDADAPFDQTLTIDTGRIAPQVTWGTNPGMVVDVDQPVPAPGKRQGIQPLGRKKCPGLHGTHTRGQAHRCGRGCGLYRQLHQFPDRRPAAGRRHSGWTQEGRPCGTAGGSRVPSGPSAGRGRRAGPYLQGRRWPMALCRMQHVPGNEPGPAAPRQRCASTSNRNFEGRQGKGGRTHLVSPEMAAAAAVAGKFVDIRKWLELRNLKSYLTKDNP